MPSIPTALRALLEPAIAAVFLTLWIVAEAGRIQGPLGLAMMVLVAIAIAVGRIWPLVSLCLVGLLLVLQLTTVLPPPESTTWPVYFGLMIVSFLVARNGSGRLPGAALALGVPIAAVVAFLIVIPSWVSPWGWASWTGRVGNTLELIGTYVVAAIVAFFLYAGAWAAGYAVRLYLVQQRSRILLSQASADLGRAETELTIVKERDRIAREVHDVLAHSLSVVIAQADGARFISAAKPEATRVALEAISDAARSSLIDVRTFIEGLREEPGDEPQPNLTDLDALVARVSAAGLAVEVQDFGAAKPMTPAQQLALYRIVQECLTNALRHAGRTTPTRISFDWRGPGLALTVSSPCGPAHRSPSDATMLPVTGHGIRGMKDRARLAGGWLTAGAPVGTDAVADAEFLVTVFLPTGSDALEPRSPLPELTA
jgi:signal transduction histidine kinase